MAGNFPSFRAALAILASIVWLGAPALAVDLVGYVPNYRMGAGDYAREVALARKLTAEYGMRIGTDGVQLLGGHGYVKEHPVERWYRDLRAIGVMEGAVLV